LHLGLPSGYRAHFDPDVLVLKRADGSVVARFSGLGFAAEEVERTAWEDHGQAAGDRPIAAPLVGVGASLLDELAFGLGRLARPDERRPDGGAKLAPLAVGLGASWEEWEAI
jgi:hypothetical protein